MKRICCMLIVLALLLSGCFLKNKPATVSGDCYQIGMSVLETTDDYLDGDITAIVAAGQIQNRCREFGGVQGDLTTDNQAVENYCEILSYTLTLVADGDHINAGEIINTRNDLAALLGEDYREQ